MDYISDIHHDIPEVLQVNFNKMWT